MDKLTYIQAVEQGLERAIPSGDRCEAICYEDYDNGENVANTVALLWDCRDILPALY